MIQCMSDFPSSFPSSSTVPIHSAVANYRNAADKGLRKVMAKMGISTLQGYRAAQIFEVIGLSAAVVKFCMPSALSRIGGIGFMEIELDILSMQALALKRANALERPASLLSGVPQQMPLTDSGCANIVGSPVPLGSPAPQRRNVEGGDIPEKKNNLLLPALGDYAWRKDNVGGDKHVFSPAMVAELQSAAQKGGYANFLEYRKYVEYIFMKTFFVAVAIFLI